MGQKIKGIAPKNAKQSGYTPNGPADGGALYVFIFLVAM